MVIPLKRSCYVVYSVTKNLRSGEIVDFTFFNCFETVDQAKASLQYEADIDKYEGDGAFIWLDEYTLRLSPGYDPDLETTVHIDNSVPFHDREEVPIRYTPGLDERIYAAEEQKEDALPVHISETLSLKI